MRTGAGQARDAVLSALDQELAAGADAGAVANDLFGVVAMVDSEPTLNRMLAEPSIPAGPKQEMLQSLLAGKVADATMTVVKASVEPRWSRVRELPDTLEYAAISAYAAEAEGDGELDRLEDDLFRFERILDASPDLRDVLSDAAAPLEGKRALLHSLLEGKVGSATLGLLDQVVSGRHRSLLGALSHYQHVVAERRDRLVAAVWVASPLTDQQKERLARALAAQYDRDVQLNVVVDPRVLGGVRVAIGDDMIDSTIETRLAQAQRRLVR